MKEIIYIVLKKLVLFFIDELLEFMDKNKDGVVDRQEIIDFVIDLRMKLTKLKRKV
ncbi:MAG: hypothetical protein ACOC5T_01960 [Elusimicrobiota bacterium]